MLDLQPVAEDSSVPPASVQTAVVGETEFCPSMAEFVLEDDRAPPGRLSIWLDKLAEVTERLFALVVLIAAAPLLLLIGILIRLDSRGPAIFTQRRVARLDRRDLAGAANCTAASAQCGEDVQLAVPTFTMYKFRTYHHRSESLVPERARFEFDPSQIDHVQLQLKDDPRITRVGRFLRSTSLDELPNFINVLRGEMRLIGPRPEVVEMVRYYTREQLKKFSVKPGITGLAQVNGRGKLNFKETLRYDLWYVHNRNWLIDLYILLKTFKVVVTRDGSF